ncbi:MAG: lipocalin family protein [Pseudomonadota bacterium]
MRSKLITTCMVAAMLLWQSTAGAQPLQTVAEVDLQRYLGKWYEIASIPQFFQKQCVGDVTAEYKMDGDHIAVTNSCRTAKGERSVAHGQARVMDPLSRSKLQVTFVKLFGWLYMLGGDYWIIDLAPDYHYAVIGHPKLTYAWILAATPSLPAQELAGIAARLKANGYDTCELLTTVQTDGASDRVPLCQAVGTGKYHDDGIGK